MSAVSELLQAIFYAEFDWLRSSLRSDQIYGTIFKVRTALQDPNSPTLL